MCYNGFTTNINFFKYEIQRLKVPLQKNCIEPPLIPSYPIALVTKTIVSLSHANLCILKVTKQCRRSYL